MIEQMDAVDTFAYPPDLNQSLGSEFGWADQMFMGLRDGLLFDYSDWVARDMQAMLQKDYKAQQLEKALSYPYLSATREIKPAKGDKGEAELCKAFFGADHESGGMLTPLDTIVDRMTTALTYKKYFAEKVWTPGTGQFENKIVYADIQHRSQTTCRALRDPKSGALAGFEQEQYFLGAFQSQNQKSIERIKMQNALIHVHGTRLDPINGTSDLEIAYWCWKTKQKIMLLWFQFMENVALPRTIVRSTDINTSVAIAKQVAGLKGSGVLPMVSQTADARNIVDITALDVSGKGSEEFRTAIQFLDNAASDSVMASFLNLVGSTANAGQAGGSLALSKDASDYFLQHEEYGAKEQERTVREQILAPFCRWNFGPGFHTPHYKYEPLNDIDKTTAVSLFEALLQDRPNAATPDEFVSMLAEDVANYIGLDGKKVAAAFDQAAKEAKDLAAKQMAMTAQTSTVAGMAGAASAATKMVKQAKAPMGPVKPAKVGA